MDVGHSIFVLGEMLLRSGPPIIAPEMHVARSISSQANCKMSKIIPAAHSRRKDMPDKIRSLYLDYYQELVILSAYH